MFANSYHLQLILLTMLGINSRSSCRKWFKKLEILPIPSSYIYSLIVFVVHNLHYTHANSSVPENTRYKNHLHIPSLRRAAIQRGTNYSAS
jgi:hypothetical protein